MSHWETRARIEIAQGPDAKNARMDEHRSRSCGEDGPNALFSCRKPGGGARIHITLILGSSRQGMAADEVCWCETGVLGHGHVAISARGSAIKCRVASSWLVHSHSDSAGKEHCGSKTVDSVGGEWERQTHGGVRHRLRKCVGRRAREAWWCCNIRVAQWEAKAGYSTNFHIFHCSSSFHPFSCSILPGSSMLYSCPIP